MDLGLHGLCPPPFYQEDKFTSTEGLISGRICMPVQVYNITCCVPCPYTDYMYADGFETRTEVANWVNVAAMISTLFILLSYTFLPVKWTQRHYLGVCLAIGIFLMELAFLVPLAAQPEQCANEITPNDMYSNNTCAISGALLIFGGWAVVIWVFWRALALHLQICWEVQPGNKFFWSTMIVGWIIPSIGVGLTLGLTGVSYRFGNVCHMNHDYGLEDFWGPLLAFATVALVLQFITIGYCANIYVRNILDDKPGSEGGSAVPSYSASISTASGKQAYRRVSQMVRLQWRGACVVLLLIAEVVFFSIIFVSMDNGSQLDQQLIERATPWLTCMALGGDKNACLTQAQALVKPEGIVIAVLICLGMSGFWLLLFLGRWSMVMGWRHVLLNKLLQHRHREFVSKDANAVTTTHGHRTYEMLDSTKSTPALNQSSPDTPRPHDSLSPPLAALARSVDRHDRRSHPLSSNPRTPEPDSKSQERFGKERKVVIQHRDVTSPNPPTVSYFGFDGPSGATAFSPQEWPPVRYGQAMTTIDHEACPAPYPGMTLSRGYT